MQIKDDRLFTYPVLAEGRDDYRTCKFSAEMKHSNETNNLVLEINFSTDCAEIKELIANGDAEYLLHVECPTTIYRASFNRSFENLSCKIPLSLLKETVYCVAFIVLCRDIKNFRCKDWNADFEWLSFDLQKGSVLAYQNLPSLKIPDDPRIFKNVASIFSIYKRVVESEPFEIDLSQDKIKIGLSAKDYAEYIKYRSNPQMQPILNAMIILPTLVYVFEQLKADTDDFETFENYGDKAWFRSLKKNYVNFVEHVIADENTSIKLAQEVMNLPITKALENISFICEETAEDS